MNRKPLISVVTVSFNCVSEIERTLLSVSDQTYTELEYIVVDGGSSDGTLDIINRYRNAIDIFVSESDHGIYDAMNKGLDAATGDWVIFMNAGDKFYSVDTITSVFNNPNDFQETNHIYGKVVSDFNGRLYHKKLNKLNFLKIGMPFCHQSVFSRLSYHKRNKFSLNYSIVSDFDFFTKSYQEGSKFARLESIVSIINPGGVSDSRRLVAYREKICVAKKYQLSLFDTIRIYVGLVKLTLVVYIKPYIPENFLKIKRFTQNILRRFYG
ncbi:glycosyltransferase [Vibrio breoganii]|uniref:glycosyltransferase family 2 protein n=1 Tax=Vibrio breoganii TaxID=553239 RepID=UPI000C81D200|nr:glycosyltransferase family 2 protein [Vibrio breoganii]PML28571.1 hypothetical protein BCT82_06850 [Vibrio breoganii]TKF88856.1 glycosyltransferase [Vibrio breoganii]